MAPTNTNPNKWYLPANTTPKKPKENETVQGSQAAEIQPILLQAKWHETPVLHFDAFFSFILKAEGERKTTTRKNAPIWLCPHLKSVARPLSTWFVLETTFQVPAKPIQVHVFLGEVVQNETRRVKS